MIAVRRIAATFLVLAAHSAYAAPQQEWLALCSKCLSSTVTSKSGIGTAHAVAEAKITRQGAQD